MADWKKIEAEYVTTDTSYRKLAEKYGMSVKTICQKSKEKNWIDKRKQYVNKTTTKLVKAESEKAVNREQRLRTAADKVLDKTTALLNCDEITGSTTALRDITRILKDLKDIQMIKSDADMREQEARIRNLEKQAEGNGLPDGKQYGVVMLPPIQPLEPPQIEEGDDDG